MTPSRTTRKATRPPACPECRGAGKCTCLLCRFLRRVGTCPACGGAGRVPANLAAIADRKARLTALAAYVAAAGLN
jgi:hypothetical protein